MGSRSYVEGFSFSSADSEVFDKFGGQIPDSTKLPHAYRWYIHIAALSGVRGLPIGSASAPSTVAPEIATKSIEPPTVADKKDAKKDADDDDFDVFGDDEVAEDEAPKESRADMLARLKKEAEERTAQKEAKQRTLVAIEIKPWDIEQDLMELWKKVTSTITQDGLKWGENCNLADVAFGIKKIQTTFVMGVNNSSDDVVEAILAMEDEVQSCEVTSMNVL
jgi:elongation factor 1-beta